MKAGLQWHAVFNNSPCVAEPDDIAYLKILSRPRHVRSPKADLDGMLAPWTRPRVFIFHICLVRIVVELGVEGIIADVDIGTHAPIPSLAYFANEVVEFAWVYVLQESELWAPLVRCRVRRPIAI